VSVSKVSSGEGRGLAFSLSPYVTPGALSGEIVSGGVHGNAGESPEKEERT